MARKKVQKKKLLLFGDGINDTPVLQLPDIVIGNAEELGIRCKQFEASGYRYHDDKPSKIERPCK